MEKQTVELEEIVFGRKTKVAVEVLGKCPACGDWVFDPLVDYKGEPSKGFNCHGWFKKKCNFGIFKTFSDKKLTEKEVIELLANRITSENVVGLKSQKGTIYDARLILDTDHKVRIYREPSKAPEASGHVADNESDGSDE